MPGRRAFLAGTAGLACALVLRTAAATPESMLAAIRALTGGVAPRTGRVRIEVPPLSENGNVVPLTVAVDSPMTPAEHVRAIHVFSEKNPDPRVLSVHLGPRSGRASLSTRIRLADTQTVIAVAELSDGSFWAQSASVVVTLAACLEELPS